MGREKMSGQQSAVSRQPEETGDVAVEIVDRLQSAVGSQSEETGESAQLSTVSGRPEVGVGSDAVSRETDAAASQSEIRHPTSESGQLPEVEEDVDVVAAIVGAIESGALSGDELKTIQDALTLSKGPGGSNENAAAADLQGGKEDEEGEPVAEVAVTINSIGISEQRLTATLDAIAFDPLETTAIDSLTLDDIDAELEFLGNPHETVQKCNGIWKEMREVHEQAVTDGERLIALCLQRRIRLEEECRAVENRITRLKQRREAILKKAEKAEQSADSSQLSA